MGPASAVNSVVVNAGGRLSPGSTLTASASSFGPSSATALAGMSINVNGSRTSDLCQVSGTVDLGTNNALVLNVGGTPLMSPASYTFVTGNVTGTANWSFTGNTPPPSGLTTSIINWTSGGDHSTWLDAGNWDLANGALVATVVQTASSLALEFTAGGSAPLPISDVRIGGVAAVTGPNVDKSVNSLTVGDGTNLASLQVGVGNLSVAQGPGSPALNATNGAVAGLTTIAANGTLLIGAPAGQPTYIGAFTTNTLSVAGSVGVASGGSLTVGNVASVNAGGTLNTAVGSGGNIHILDVNGGAAILNGAQSLDAANVNFGNGGSLAANGGTIGDLFVSDSTASVTIGGAAVNNAYLSSNGSATMSAGTITNASVYETAGLTANGGKVTNLSIDPAYAGTTTIGAAAIGPAHLVVPSGNVNLNNVNPTTSLAVVGGNVTLGNGFNTGTLTATGGNVNVATTNNAVATANILDVSSGSPVVNTSPLTNGSMKITSQLKLPNSQTVSVVGGAFNVSGANVANIAGTPGMLTLGGGTVTAASPAGAVGTTLNAGQGSYSYQGGSNWTVNGQGSDMWNTDANSYYVYTPQKSNQNFDVMTYVNISSRTNDWAKCGILVAGGAPGAVSTPYIFSAITQNSGATMQWCEVQGNTNFGPNLTGWIRLSYDHTTGA